MTRAGRRTRFRLGNVAAVAARWGVAERLARAESFGEAYRACLAGAVEADARAALQAGRAWPRERRILLHRELLRPGREAERDATFLHECAHVLTDLRHGEPCRHGPPWRATMALLGEPSAARHDIPYLSREARARYVWTCAACGEGYPFVRKPRRRIGDCYCRRCGPDRGSLVQTTPE